MHIKYYIDEQHHDDARTTKIVKKFVPFESYGKINSKIEMMAVDKNKRFLAVANKENSLKVFRVDKVIHIDNLHESNNYISLSFEQIKELQKDNF